jgi:hypothetical protein
MFKNTVITLSLFFSSFAFADTTYQFASSGTAYVYPNSSIRGNGLIGVSEDEAKGFESEMACGKNGESYVLVNPIGKFSISDELCETTHQQMVDINLVESARFIFKRKVAVFAFTVNEDSVVSVTKTGALYKRAKQKW